MAIYQIGTGKYTASGSGSSEVTFEISDLELATEKFIEQVEYEKKTIKDWHLKPTEYVEVALVEYDEENEEYDWLQVVHLNYKGEEI